MVTSVPSDAPDDYIALKELKDKPLWREKFGLTAEMVDPFEVIPIIGRLGCLSTLPPTPTAAERRFLDPQTYPGTAAPLRW